MDRRMTPLTPDELDDDQRALYLTLTGGPRAQGPQHFALTSDDGSLRGPFDGFLRAPAIGAALQELGASIRFRSGLSDRQREMAILLVAARWDSAFERDAHEAIGRAAGLSEDELAALRGEDAAAFGADDALLAETVTRILDGDLDDAAWSSAVGAFGERGVFELTTLVGYYGTLALQLRIFRIP